MSALWTWISARHLLGEGRKTLLTLLGVALGVAVFVSIRLANHSAMASFSATVDNVAGRANLQVVSDTEGFPESLLSRVAAYPGVRAAAPVIEEILAAQKPGTRVGKPPVHSVLVLGIDPTASKPFYDWTEEQERIARTSNAMAFALDPRAAVITRALADRLQLEAGSQLEVFIGGSPTPLNIYGVMDAEQLQDVLGGNVVIMLLPAAQQLVGQIDRLSRIDLLVEPSQVETVRQGLSSVLPANARAATPQTRTRQIEHMVEAFALNLTALSFVALLVSCFLIFNAVSLSVLRRRGEIGILRGLGVKSFQILTMFLTEAAAIGLLGSVVGLVLGRLMAQLTLAAVAQTITALYVYVHATKLQPDIGVYAAGLALGTVSAVVAAIPPAMEAASAPAHLTQRQGSLVEARGVPVRRAAWIGVGLLGCALAAGLWTIGLRRPQGGFASAFFLVAGFCLLSPLATLAAQRLAGVAARVGGIEASLGVRYLGETIIRTSVVISALMVSVGMLVGLSIMVGSFRRTVDTWVRQTVRGDLYVTPVGRNSGKSASTFPAAAVEAARRVPEFAAVDTFRAVQTTFRERLVMVAGLDLQVQRDLGGLRFVSGSARDRINQALDGRGALISESFGHRYRLKVGDSVDLAAPIGLTRLRVMGIFYDYSTDGGYVMLDYRLFAELWKTDRTESLAAYLKPGVTPEAGREALSEAIGQLCMVQITTNRALRERALRVFDQTFRITYALQAIAVLVSTLGIVSNLTALITQRGREIGVLRAIGATRGQVRKMVLAESAVMGFAGTVMGCLCGSALAVLMIHVINKQFFGWSIHMTVDPMVFVQTLILMVITSILAGIPPARLAASRPASAAMRDE